MTFKKSQNQKSDTGGQVWTDLGDDALPKVPLSDVKVVHCHEDLQQVYSIGSHYQQSNSFGHKESLSKYFIALSQCYGQCIVQLHQFIHHIC